MAATSSKYDTAREDFRRYLAGEMSAGEEYSMEKRMLDEPLFGAAFEGFVAMQDQNVGIENVMEDLNGRLEKRLPAKSEKVYPLWAYATAASVFLMMGAAWILFQADREMAVQDTPRQSGPAQAYIAPEKKKEDFSALKTTPQQVAQAPVISPLPQKFAKSKAEGPDTSNNKPPGLASKDSFSDRIASNQKSENRSALPEISASAPLSRGDRLAGASPAILSREIATDSSAKSFSNEAAEQSGLREKPRLKSSSSAFRKRAMAKSTDSLPAPQQGWEQYRAYLSVQSGKASATDDVDVTFTVNPDGTLTGFRTRGSRRAAKKAVKIVKNGPGWTPVTENGKPVAGEITLRFHFGKE